MPTKTERILGYLPQTFRAGPRHLSPLYFVVAAFGNELLNGENSLAALMHAHWVNHADRGERLIDDLARIAALYGLAPRSDEGVEEFRDHLLRYIRTFLEGTVTVQGALRVTAEALGLHIADEDDEALDAWWNRAEPELLTHEPDYRDAQTLIFGVKRAKVKVKGQAARAAQVKGNVPLLGGVDLSGLSGGAKLRLVIDDGNPITLNLAHRLKNDGKDLTHVSLTDLIAVINSELNAPEDSPIARKEGPYLVLASPTKSAASRLEVQDVEGDAAERLLGLLPRVYNSAGDAEAAQVIGPDLSAGFDLHGRRYLRIRIDGAHLAEIDLGEPADLEAVRDMINAAFPTIAGDIAAVQDGRLVLTSRTKSAASILQFERPAAGDATRTLFGAVEPLYTGRDAQPAPFVGLRDVSEGIDLSRDSILQLSFDGSASVSVNCAGSDPAQTIPAEIVAAINTAVGAPVAGFDGQHITLTSTEVGGLSQVAIETAPEHDASLEILGLNARVFTGRNARPARLQSKAFSVLDEEGEPVFTPIDLAAQHRIMLAVDGGDPVEVDLQGFAESISADDLRKVTLEQLETAINAALGKEIASNDGERLTLISATQGSASGLELRPLDRTQRRRYVTRAAVTDEAATKVFGFYERTVHGTAATAAQLVGKADLSRGVDLRGARYLGVQIDDYPPVDVDCAGKRPHATTLEDVIKALREALGDLADAVDTDGKHLILTSPSAGENSRIAVGGSSKQDALAALGFVPLDMSGQDTTSVAFVSTVDLSGGLDLPANAAIRLSIDKREPVTISLTAEQPAHLALNDLIALINVAAGRNMARRAGNTIAIVSAERGEASELIFSAPETGTDATLALFGIAAPRTYQGDAASGAWIRGEIDLTTGPDLEITRFLRIGIDGRSPVDVDCASIGEPKSASVTDIMKAINAALPGVASVDGGHLVLSSPTKGINSRIVIERFRSDSTSKQKLFGDVPDEVRGEAAQPAVITGEIELIAPPNLSQRQIVRIAIDGADPVDIRLGRLVPETTYPTQIVEDINAVLPGVASLFNERIRLTSPTAGETSAVAVLALRHLEVIEYPAQEGTRQVQDVRHGSTWTLDNDGTADASAAVTIHAPLGVTGPTLLNRTLNWRVSVLSNLRAGETLSLWRGERGGISGEVSSAEGETRPVPDATILVCPPGPQAWVPFSGQRSLRLANQGQVLHLNNPLAAALVTLRGRALGVRVDVIEKETLTLPPDDLPGDGQTVTLEGRIRAGGQNGDEYSLHGADDTKLATLWQGPGVRLREYRDRVVQVSGPRFFDEEALIVVQDIHTLFDVGVQATGNAAGDPEYYLGVTIGDGFERADSLARQVCLGSRLVVADEQDKGTVLSTPHGRSEWLYADCVGSRFDRAWFEAARFAGRYWFQQGLFDLHGFNDAEDPDGIHPIFALADQPGEPPVTLTFAWAQHEAGAFEVRLPADLPPRFGGRFNEARYGQAPGKVERYERVVVQPWDDDNALQQRIDAKTDSLVRAARHRGRAPSGWASIRMPFRQPAFLTGGHDGREACVYLTEESLEGEHIEIRAREVGAWGNEIAVTARKAGPGMYDVEILYAGARFENARQVALGLEPGSTDDLAALTQKLIQPGPVGLLQAKAAGVRLTVTREGMPSAE